MSNIDEFEFVFHKALAECIISEIEPLVKKVTKQAEKLIEKVDVRQKKIEQLENTKKINKLISELENFKEQLISVLCIKNRLELLISRNNQREKFLSGKLKEVGIYVNKVDKKRFSDLKKEYLTKVSDETLNLNQNNSSMNVVYQNIGGQLLMFVNGKLDLSEDYNINVLAKAEQAFVIKIVENYPESVNTILPESLTNVQFKKKISKAVASIVLNGKENSVNNINAKFGGLLSFKKEIPKDSQSYVAGVLNMFNVMVKHHLMSKNPENQLEIKRKLKCNEKSELVPASKKIIAFADGLSGEEEIDEELKSEEIRKETEQDIENDLFAQFELDIQMIEKELEAELLKEKEQRQEYERTQKIKKEEEMIEQEKEVLQMLKKDNPFDE